MRKSHGYVIVNKSTEGGGGVLADDAPYLAIATGMNALGVMDMSKPCLQFNGLPEMIFDTREEALAYKQKTCSACCNAAVMTKEERAVMLVKEMMENKT